MEGCVEIMSQTEKGNNGMKNSATVSAGALVPAGMVRLIKDRNYEDEEQKWRSCGLLA